MQVPAGFKGLLFDSKKFFWGVGGALAASRNAVFRIRSEGAWLQLHLVKVTRVPLLGLIRGDSAAQTKSGELLLVCGARGGVTNDL